MLHDKNITDVFHTHNKNVVEFIINSYDRIYGNSSNYTMTLKDYIRLPNSETPKYCKVVGINFTNGVYNVNSNNNVITIFETSASSNTIITLPIGAYSASQLTTQLQTSLNSASQVSNTYVVSYSSQTYKLTITASTYTFYFVNTSLLLGMMNNSTTSLTQISSQGIRILYDYFIFRCDLIGNYVSTNQNYNSGSFIIPLGLCDIGATTFLGQSQLPCIIKPFVPKLGSFSVQLYDPYGNQIDNNGFEHQIILELF